MAAADDQSAQHWLTVLRDGTHGQKMEARLHLADVFEQRGMLEEAADLLVTNYNEGYQTPEAVRRITELHRKLGRPRPHFAQLPSQRYSAPRAEAAPASRARSAELEAALTQVFVAVGWAILGVGVTFGSFAFADKLGGHFIVWWGPVAFGALMALKHLLKAVSVLARRRPGREVRECSRRRE